MDTNQQDDLRIVLAAIDGLIEEGDCAWRLCLAEAIVAALHGVTHNDGSGVGSASDIGPTPEETQDG